MNIEQLARLTEFLDHEALKILLVLSLSFLLGLEREGRKAKGDHYFFGGVRTYPLIGLTGYAVALLAGGDLMLVAVGLLVAGLFFLVSYRHKLGESGEAGVTTEFSGLLTYLLGVLVFQGRFWVATTLVIVCLMLLQLKAGLEGLTERIPREEVITFTQFLLLSVVILPVVPDRAFTQFNINPFKTWLIVVAVSTVSYGSYLLQKVARERGGVVLAAILGGAYSSTVTTVSLARRARRANRPNLFAGSMLVASGTMYLRLVALLAIFSRALMDVLLAPFLVLGFGALLAGGLAARVTARNASNGEPTAKSKNPLELHSAFLFAAVFVAVTIVTTLALRNFGETGMYGLAVIMGVTDVDPFIMSLTQTAGHQEPVVLAAAAVVLTTASNNVMKGVYAFALADRRTGVRGLAALLGLAVAGLVPLLFLS